MNFPEYLRTDCEISGILFNLDKIKGYEKDYYYKLMNLEERQKLPENFQDYFVECDKYYISQIYNLKWTIGIMKSCEDKLLDLDDYKIRPDLKDLEVRYKLEIQRNYDIISDKLFIEKAKIKIKEQDEKISLLKNEIDEIKSLLSLKSNSKKDVRIQSF
jgi:hypothetical protein